MGKESCFTEAERSLRKSWSVSVACRVMSEGVVGEERMARETIPEPLALSWIMDPEEMEGMRVMLWTANCVVTGRPVALYTVTLPGPDTRAWACLGMLVVGAAMVIRMRCLECVIESNLDARRLYVPSVPSNVSWVSPCSLALTGLISCLAYLDKSRITRSFSNDRGFKKYLVQILDFANVAVHYELGDNISSSRGDDARLSGRYNREALSY
jgi:hypothetical protein